MTWPWARWALWSWPTPAAWPIASRPLITSSGQHIPFVVGVNCVDGARRYHPEQVRMALDLDRGPGFVVRRPRPFIVPGLLVTLVDDAADLAEASRRPGLARA